MKREGGKAMTKRVFAHAAACVAAASGLALAGALLGCPTQEEKMDLGEKVNREVAMPTSDREMKMTEEERRARAAAEQEALEQKEFNDSDQGDNEPAQP
jgi:hypothetical protein